MEHKTFLTLEHKVLDDVQGIVEHFVAITGNRDLGRDRIITGAFRKTILERGLQTKVLDHHRTDSIQAVIGMPLSMQEVGRDQLPAKVLLKFPEATGGLKVTTQYLMETPEGRGAFLRIKAGAVSEYSIGYDAVKGGTSYTKSADGETERQLKEIKLWEYSPVIFGMNPATTTLSAKSSEAEPDPEVEPEDEGKKSIGTLAESRVHNLFTNFADEWYGDERITREERIILSGAIGDALTAFVAKIQSDAGQLYSRNLYDYSDVQNIIKSIKAGRTISAATLAKLKAARDVIDELCSMGEYSDAPDDDEDPEEVKSAPGGVPQAADNEQEQQAGPVTPPTSKLLQLIEIELSELHHWEV